MRRRTEYVEPEIDLRIPERARLAELLCRQPKDQPDGEELIIKTNDLMLAIYGKREGQTRPPYIQNRTILQLRLPFANHRRANSRPCP